MALVITVVGPLHRGAALSALVTVADKLCCCPGGKSLCQSAPYLADSFADVLGQIACFYGQLYGLFYIIREITRHTIVGYYGPGERWTYPAHCPVKSSCKDLNGLLSLRTADLIKHLQICLSCFHAGRALGQGQKMPVQRPHSIKIVGCKDNGAYPVIVCA